MAPSLVDKDGIWGKPTSTLDWCEENYVVTPYVAEFWNTISNVVMIIPPLFCAIYFWRIGLELRFVILNIALLVVGVGSWLFHMTLKYEMQMLDELPMIYGTTVFVYAIRTTSQKVKEPFVQDIMLPVSYCLLVSIAYLTLRNPVVHQAFYGSLVFYMIYKCVQVCQEQPKITRYVLTSFVLYLIGFILWNVDNFYCSSIRQTRHKMAHYSKPLLQLHAWWHLFSGLASSLQISFCAYARVMHHKHECSIKMMGSFWPYLEVRRKP